MTNTQNLLSNIDFSTLRETPFILQISEEVTATFELDNKTLLIELKAASWDRHITRTELMFAHNAPAGKSKLYRKFVNFNPCSSQKKGEMCELSALEQHATAMASTSFLVKELENNHLDAIGKVLDAERSDRQRQRRLEHGQSGINSAVIQDMESNEQALSLRESCEYIEEVKQLLLDPENQISQKIISVKTSPDTASQNGGVVTKYQYLARVKDGICEWVDICDEGKATVEETEIPNRLWLKVFA